MHRHRRRVVIRSVNAWLGAVAQYFAIYSIQVLIAREYQPLAKPSSIVVKMVSSADTGYYYVTKKNPRTQTEKLEMRKYDPVARKHVAFKEGKIK